MTHIAIRHRELPVDLDLGTSLGLGDEALFELCRRNRELRIERSSEGDLEVMTSTGGLSSHRNAEILFALIQWAHRDGRGLVFDSSGGFLLPNGAMRSPDAAWVLRSRLEDLSPEIKQRFLPLAPDFVIELRSPSDPLEKLQAKMEEYVAQGVRLGWLIDPDERRVHVVRPSEAPEMLDNPERLSGEPVLPGFELDLRPVWAGI
jgi:Uma2 family endonuclease